MNIDEHINVKKENGIGWVTFIRPEKKNILDTGTLKQLDEILKELEGDDRIRAVIITGTNDFSAGADVHELRGKRPVEAEFFSRLGHKVFNRVETMGKPVIAAVGGYALGAGCELALACDLRIADEKAKFGLPEANLGLIPGFGGTQRLARLIGIGKAKELILTGRIIDANEAASIGLVNSVVNAGELKKKAEEMALVLVQKSPITIRKAKNLINRNQEIHRALDMEIAAFSECFRSEDHAEGISAFLEKRKPVFKGT